MTGSPSPARLNGGDLPIETKRMAASYEGMNPGVLADRARYGLEATFGLPSNDPWIVAGCLAGTFYIEYLTELALERHALTDEEAQQVMLMCRSAGNHWRAALIQLGAVPAPPGYNHEETN